MKKKIIIFIFSIFILILFFYNFNFIKEKIPQNYKIFIKETFLAFKYIDQYKKEIEFKEQKIENLKSQLSSDNYKIFGKEKYELINNKYDLKKYKNTQFIFENTRLRSMPRAYIEEIYGKVFLVSGTGRFFISTHEVNFDNDYIIFKQIKNNFHEKFITDQNYEKDRASIVKNVIFLNQNIYISYIHKKNDKCFYNSIIKAVYNPNFLNFEKFYSTDYCMPYFDDSSGGNLASDGLQNLFFTVGDWGLYNYKNNDVYKQFKNIEPQSLESPLGKIIEINTTSKISKIVSIGHRNQQGLFFDKFKKILYSTEHGPLGGDEVNANNKLGMEIMNYGWPIVSYGEHYDSIIPSLIERTEERYKKAPLHKSHEEYGFEEPIKNFTPSIGISQILKINKNKEETLYIASLGNKKEEGDLSLHQLKLNPEQEIINHEIFYINDRIRDMIYVSNKNIILMFLEKTGSIGMMRLD